MKSRWALVVGGGPDQKDNEVLALADKRSDLFPVGYPPPPSKKVKFPVRGMRVVRMRFAEAEAKKK